MSKRNILIAVSILAVIIIGWLAYTGINTDPAPVATSTALDDTRLREMATIGRYKLRRALTLSLQGVSTETVFVLNDALADFEDLHRSTAANGGSHWSDTASLCAESLILAREAVLAGDHTRAATLLEGQENSWRQEFVRLGIIDQGEVILGLYRTALDISAQPDRSTITPRLDSLKLPFAGIKESYSDARYYELIALIESDLTTLDRSLDGPDLQNAKRQLPEHIAQLYINFL